MILLLSVVTFILWLIQKQWKMRKVFELSRRIRSKYTAWPIIGHKLHLLGTAEDRMKTIQKFGREAIKSEYGLVSAWMGSEFCVVTCDATIAETILITKAVVNKSEEIANTAQHLLGNASIFASVNIWRQRRKLIAPPFSSKNLLNYVEVFAKQSEVLTHCLKSKAGSGAFSVWNNFTSCTMDMICQTTLGIEINVQKLPLHPVLSAVHKYLARIPLRFIQPNPRLDWLFKRLPFFKEAEEAKTTIHDFIDEIIRNKRILIDQKYNDAHERIVNSKNQMRDKSFIDQLMSCESDGRHRCTGTELREEALVLFLAGNDTSAVAASFTTVMLSRHLDVQEKAYKEVHNIFGDSKRHVTYEDLSRLKYTEAVIKESLRLYPPIPIVIRKIDTDVELSSGIVLPAGTYTFINIWGLHRNPRYWGVDAEEFNPDRFLNGSTINDRAYMPFSYGPRNCLGYRYAMMSLKIMLATLLREYKVLPPSDVSSNDLKKPLRLEYSIMTKDIDNFNVRLEHRT